MAEEPQVQPQEDPTLGGNPETEPQKPELKEEDVSAFLAELEKAGVENPSQLAGQLQNAREYGRVGGLLGEERQRTAELTSEVQSLRDEIRKMGVNTNPYDDNYDNSQGTVNIETIVENAVGKVLAKEKKAQLEIQQRSMQTWGKIQSDPKYGLVKDIWEEKMKDPNFSYKIQTGQVDPLEEFNNTKVGFYERLAMKSAEMLKSLTEGNKVNAPHVEAGDRSPQLPKPPTESQEEIQSLKDKVNKGYVPSGDDELAALANVLGG